MFGLLTGSSDAQDLINRALIWLPLAVVSLSLHEFGHAATAYAFGDQTPKSDGRITLNPFAHLDVFGTLMMLLGPIGWAKPVRIDPSAMRGGRFAELVVSFAGPAMNILLALAAAACLKYLSFTGEYAGATDMLSTLFILNIGLAVFNLLPIPPLDGGHIWPAILPRSLHPAYYHFLPYGMILLIVLVMWPGANSGLSALVRSAALFVFGLLP